MQDDVIRASAVRFVRGQNLETDDAVEVGFGEFVGFGELEIRCHSYEREQPS